MHTNTEAQVYCTLQIEGTHNWPDCPFDEVNYLKSPHRHVFYIKAYKKVKHHDRDTEFIVLQHQIRKLLKDSFWNETKQLHTFGAMSCEMIGQLLIDNLHLCKVDVSEDNENGAVLYAMENG